MFLAICASPGRLVNRLFFGKVVLLPGFLPAMLIAIASANINDVIPKTLSRNVVDGFGEVGLSIFLSMSMMSIKLWLLAEGLTLILLVPVVQVLVMTLFATFVVFRLMGRDCDAVAISAGFTGLGLSATPVAIATMDAVTVRFGPSPKAFLVAPLVGAFLSIFSTPRSSSCLFASPIPCLYKCHPIG